MRAGLWELTTQSDLVRMLPKFSAAQIEQMRVMGIDVPDVRDGTIVNKICISPEMAAQDEPPLLEPNDSGCRRSAYQRDGSRYSMTMQCDGAEVQGQGQITGVFGGNQRFTSTSRFEGIVHGLPLNQTQQTSGRWLAEDCGAVRPLDRFGQTR
jgi:hypothetical protein